MPQHRMPKKKITLWITPETLAWLETQDGPSLSYKIEEIVRRYMNTRKRSEIDSLIDWLDKRPPYVLGITDPHGLTVKGRIELKQLLKNYVEETYWKPKDRKNDFINKPRHKPAELEGVPPDPEPPLRNDVEF